MAAPGPEGGGPMDSPVHRQAQSILLALPAEIRLHVYHLIFYHNVVHVWAKETNEIVTKWYHVWCLENESRYGYYHFACNHFKLPRKSMLGLPLSCKLIYLETIQMLYNRHTFHVNCRLSDFAPAIPITHFSSIVSLSLPKLSAPITTMKNKEEYQKTWDIVAKMPNLKFLYVTIWHNFPNPFPTRGHWEDLQEALTEPMRQVTQPLEVFDVLFPSSKQWFNGTLFMRISHYDLEWDSFLIDTGEEWEGLPSPFRALGVSCKSSNDQFKPSPPPETDLLQWMNSFPLGGAPRDREWLDQMGWVEKGPKSPEEHVEQEQAEFRYLDADGVLQDQRLLDLTKHIDPQELNRFANSADTAGYTRPLNQGHFNFAKWKQLQAGSANGTANGAS